MKKGGNNSNKKPGNNGAPEPTEVPLEKKEQKAVKKDSGKGEQGESSRRPEKETKRRSSLTDSPLTSSSSSADDTELRNRKELSTTSPYSSVNSVDSCSSNAAVSTANISNSTTTNVDSSLPSATTTTNSNTDSKLGAKGGADGVVVAAVVDERSTGGGGEADVKTNNAKKRKRRKDANKNENMKEGESSHSQQPNSATGDGVTVAASMPILSTPTPPAYSTASQQMGLTTVSTVASRMSCTQNEALNSAADTSEQASTTTAATTKSKKSKKSKAKKQQQTLAPMPDSPKSSVFEPAAVKKENNIARELASDSEFCRAISSMTGKTFTTFDGRLTDLRAVHSTAHRTPLIATPHMDTSAVSPSTGSTFLDEHGDAKMMFIKQRKSIILKYGNGFVGKLHRAIFDGLYDIVLRNVRAIALVLVRQRPMSSQRCANLLYTNIIEKLAAQFFSAAEGLNILTTLTGFDHINNRCSENDHGYCKLMKTVLRYVSDKERANLLLTKATHSGKTLLHLVASNGETCQMNVLLNAGVDPNIYDNSGRAPLHYAINRGYQEMIRILMWYGADMALCPKGSLVATQNDGAIHFPFATYLMQNTYLNLRMDALKHRFTAWTKLACAKLGNFEVLHPLSPVHFLKYYTFENAGLRESEQVASIILEKSVYAQPIDVKPYIFMMPTAFTLNDTQSDVREPFYFRSNTPGVSIDNYPIFVEGDDIGNTDWRKRLCAKFGALNDEYITAFELPRDVGREVDLVPYRLRLRIRSTHPFPSYSQDAGNTQFPTLSMMVFACRHSNPMEYLELKRNGKSKFE